MPVGRNLRLISIFSFLTGSLFIMPVMLLFYKDHVGIGYQGLLIAESAFAASCVLFDVPTSWISDVWRRKHSLALGTVFILTALAVFAMARNIWVVVLSQVLWGVGQSLLNGTNAAMIYDTLLVLGREKEYQKWDGKRLAYTLYGMATAGALGGFAYEIDNFLPIYLSMGFQLLALLVSAAMHEPERHKKIGEKHPVSDVVRTIKFVLSGHADLGIVIGLTAAVFCATKLIMFSQQPYFMAIELPARYYGVLMAVGWGLGGLSGHLAHFLDGKVRIFKVLAFAVLASMFVCLGAAAYLGYSGVVLLMFGGTCVYGIISPRVNEAINRSVGSERRATALSSLSLVYHLMFIPLSYVIGWVNDIAGVRLGLLSVALWLALAGASAFAVRLWRAKAAIRIRG